MTGARIRRATPAEAGVLTDLALNSKAHWGYDRDFMDRARPEMTLTPSEVGDHETWALEDGGAIVGFYRVVPTEPALLEDLWLDPAAMGMGRGRLLWDHALGTARAIGAVALELDADPHAVGFYERMGARRVGETASAIVPGRMLPRMRIDLA